MPKFGTDIARLAYAVLCANWWNPKQVQVTAVEVIPEYVKVGRRLLPEVTWVQGDIYDLHLWQSLPRFDEAISNPPFGQVLTDSDTDWIGYRGPAGLMVAAIGLKVTRLGMTLILPQTQTPYRYSGHRPGENVYPTICATWKPSWPCTLSWNGITAASTPNMKPTNPVGAALRRWWNWSRSVTRLPN